MRIFPVILLTLMLSACCGSTEEKCRVTDKIVSVGGCNKYGNCGAMTEHGYKTIEHMPVVGEEITIRVRCQDMNK